MRPGGWRRFRRIWRKCRWAGCADEIVAPIAQLCHYHWCEDDRLAVAFKAAQLPLPFPWVTLARAYVPRFVIADTQIAFQIPYPKLPGSRDPQVQPEQTYEQLVAEIRRDQWLELKEKYEGRLKKQTGRKPRNGQHVRGSVGDPIRA